MRADAEPRNRWWLVAVSGTGVFMAQLDATIVGVALPSIGADLDARPGLTQWVVLGYVLPVLALTLPAGRWLDRVGHRSALAFSVAGFTVASVAAGLAPDVGWLVAARVLQGGFGAVLFALLPVLATTAVRPEARGRATGVMTTLGPLGAVTGPSLGGLIVDTAGWSWIFYVNVPIGAALILVGRAQLARGRPLALPDRAWLREAGLLSAAAVALALGLSMAATAGPAWIALVLAGVPFAVAWLRSSDSRAVTDLLRTPGIGGPHAALTATAAAAMLTLFLLPFFLQDALGISPTTTGLTLLVFAAAGMLLGPIGGVLADRRSPRWTAFAGAVALSVGLLALLPLDPEWTPIDVGWRLALAGAGSGLLNGPLMSIVMGRAPRQLLGTVGASTSLARQIGIATGPALATLAWATSGYELSGMRFGLGLAVLGALLGAAAFARAPAERPRTSEETPVQAG